MSLNRHLLMAACIVIASSALGQPPNGVGTVQGVVLDVERQPISGATVYGLPESDMRRRIRTRTDPLGRFTLTDVPAGSIYLHAFKESDWYPDNFYSFFANGIGPIKVGAAAGETTEVTIPLGPKSGRLNLAITGPAGEPVRSASARFRRDDVPNYYERGVSGQDSLLVPPVPFRMTIDSPGYEQWSSKVITVQSSKSLDLAVHLVRRP